LSTYLCRPTPCSEVEKAYGAVVGRWSFHLNFNQQPFKSIYVIDNDDDEWVGISAKENERDEEYEDEEMLATVTVVEDFDPDTIIHGPPKPDHPSIARPDYLEPKPKPSRQLQSNSGFSKKPRQRKIPYETTDARKKERTKQRARRTEKAELAGGKVARKSKSARGVRGKASFKR
jgi:ribosomal RNA-processing protein 17